MVSILMAADASVAGVMFISSMPLVGALHRIQDKPRVVVLCKITHK